jgi:1-acyl-sn-glycerol-3-phosphate acyltransferase
MRRFFGSLLFNVGWYAWTAVLAIIGLPVLLLPAAAVRAYARFWVRGILVWLRLTCQLTYRVRGLENLPSGPVIIAARHQSSWETLAFEVLFADSATVLKRELFWIPVVGWMMWRAGHLGVDRGAGASALRRLLRDARAVVGEGRRILIYPEGTRTPPGAVAPYQPGTAALYAQLRLPVVPVALNSGVFWARRVFIKHPGEIEVEVLPPIPPGMPRAAFIGELQRRINEASDRLSGPARQLGIMR